MDGHTDSKGERPVNGLCAGCGKPVYHHNGRYSRDGVSWCPECWEKEGKHLKPGEKKDVQPDGD